MAASSWLMGSASAAGSLGLGSASAGQGMLPAGLGNQLSKQVADETDEEKLRKRLGLSVTQTGGSLAVQSLFGGLGGSRL